MLLPPRLSSLSLSLSLSLSSKMEGDLNNCHTDPASFFSSETGVYSSKHPPRALPQDPLEDLVSFLFSREHRGTTALVDSSSGSSISYRELRSMVASTASGLRSAGVSSGQAVLLLLPNSILYPVLFLGVLRAGAVATTMNHLSTAEEIGKSLGSCSPVVAFTSSDRVEEINGLGIRAIAVPDALSFDSTKKFSPFAYVLSGGGGGGGGGGGELPMPKIRQTDAACVLYSSGTSGPTKGVVLSHANMIAAAELFVRFEASQYAARSWENVYLAALPMFHVYGLVLFAVGLLSLGSTVVVMGRFDAEGAARAIERFEVTHFPLVPPVLAALVRARGATGCDLRSLKQVSSGAAPLSSKVIQDFLHTFPHVDLVQGYGMTESAAVGTRGFNTEKLKKHNSVGLLAPNMQAKVVDCNSGACLPPGKSGELWLCGPGIMKGYLNDEMATSSTIDKNGWLRTGDIAYFDEDGYLYVLDRLKDIIKYKGYQIAPADLEAVLISHPEIIDVGVTSGEDEEDVEIPVAFVVRKPGSEFSADQVMKYVSKKVAPYKKVRRVVFVQSIPKSPTGKILRRLLRSNHGISRM